MNTVKGYKLQGFLLLVIMISVSLSACDTPECCGIGCGVLGGSSNCNRSRPSEPFMGFHEPNDIVVTPDGDFAVADQGALVHVDQVTGDRVIISQFAPLDKDRTGGGANIGIGRIAVRAGGDFAVLGGNTVANVDQNTGKRTIISDENTGVGPEFFFLRDLAVTPDGDFVVVNGFQTAVVHVDQITGDRTIISDENTGNGPGIEVPVSIESTSDGDYIVLDIVTGLGGFGTVIHVDQITGDRTIISDETTGIGPEFDMPEDIAVTPGGDFVVVDSGMGAVVHVDQFTGDRSIISDGNVGMGPEILLPKAIAVTADGDFVVIDRERDIRAVVFIDQFTGDRTIISDENTGSGP